MAASPNKLAFWSAVAGASTFYVLLRQSSNVLIAATITNPWPAVGTLQPLSSSTVPLAAIMMSDTGTPGHYFASPPASLPPGNYSAEYYQQMGASPSINDPLQSSHPYHFDPSGQT